MTTDEAFEKLLNTRGIYKTLGVHRGTVGSMKALLKNDEVKISLDKKIELLKKAGYIMKQDIVWKEPPAEQA